MVSVTADQIRKRLGLTVADISDEDVLAFREEAVAFLSEEIGKTLNTESCTEAEANAIRNLAAIYCYCKVSGYCTLTHTSLSTHYHKFALYPSNRFPE